MTITGCTGFVVAYLRGRSIFAGIALLIVFSGAVLLFRFVPLEAALGGLLIVCLSAVPILLYLQRPEPIPFLPAIGAYYLVFYGLPVFLAPLAYRQADNVVLYERIVLGPLKWGVTALVAAAIAAMFCGFYVARRWLFRKVPRLHLPDAEPRAEVLNWCYWILLLASLAYRLVPEIGSLPSIGQFLDPAGFLALGGFFLQWRAGRLPKGQAALILFVCVPLDLYTRVRFFFVTDVLMLCIFAFFVLWRCEMYRTIVAILFVGLITIFSYSATTAYRGGGDTLVSKVASTSAGIGKILQVGHVEKETAHVGPISYLPAISPLINRIGHIWIFQTVYERSPDPIPYWAGESYKPLLTSFIPRLIYPDKPMERAGAAFGQRYGFGEAGATSYNIPWVVELLANFGPYGVLMGMPLLGMFLAFLDRIFNGPDTSDLEFLIGLTIIFRLFYQESNFSVMTGSLPVLALSLYVYFRAGPLVVDGVLMRFAPRGTN